MIGMLIANVCLMTPDYFCLNTWLALFFFLSRFDFNTLPPDILLLGHRLSHDVKCLLVAHLVISTPTSDNYFRDGCW